MDIFGKVAVASTFSPRFLPLLDEAITFARLLDRPLEVIHAGTASPENEERFSAAFSELGFSGPIHWREASELSDAIIQAVCDSGIGLLLAGAMERDKQGRYFLGGVARALVLDAPCSLLLFANPTRPPAPFRNLAVVVDFSPASRHALAATLALAIRAKAESIHVLRVFTVFAQLLAEPTQFVAGHGRLALDDEQARLDDFVAEFDSKGIPIITRCIENIIPANLLVIRPKLE
jgi:nucleotide-binding universal stress UspA family protein